MSLSSVRNVFSVLRSPTAVVAVSVFLTFSGFTLIIPVLPFIVGQFVPFYEVARYVSLIIAAYALCAFLAAPVLGAFSDRLGRRPVLLFSIAGSAIGFVIFGVGGALWVLFAGRIIDGLTAGNISAMYAYIADTHAPRDRGAAFGFLGAAGGLGFMLGPALGGFLGDISYALPAFAAAGVAVLNALWVYLCVPESLHTENRSDRLQWNQLNPFRQLIAVFNNKAILPIFAGSFLFFTAATLMQSNLGVLMKESLAFTPAFIGVAMLGVGMMDIVSQGVATPRLLPRFGERRVAISGLVINAIGFALLVLLAARPSIALLAIAIAMLTFGDGLVQPSINAIISGATPADQQGRVQGANQAQQAIARVIGPLGSAILYEIFPGAPYLAGALLLVAAIVVLAPTRLVSAQTDSAPR
jgi:DHA1 family tetracycline resistance protein-like MFS transporter